MQIYSTGVANTPLGVSPSFASRNPSHSEDASLVASYNNNSIIFIIVLIRSVIISPILEPSLNETILAESRIWGTRVKLVPRVFAFESSSYDVKVKLRGAGFRLEKNKKVWTKYKFEEGLGRKIYTRRIHYNGSCKVTAYVFIEFSNNQQLIFAEGTVDEDGCI